ncbi:MAG: ATP-binding protein [Elusimicrobiota bacterium]|nr:ATP-binding protein [Elusimicrobiota bacterium]
MQKLQTKSQTFETLREGNFLYIDKTKHVHELVKDGNGAYFLSRPRRFGKSLLLSTFESLFSGDKKLFEGLYIYDKWDWGKKYPVIKFDLSVRSSRTAEILSNSLASLMLGIAQDNEITLNEQYAPERFSELIEKLYEKKKQKVVILIDEYDKAVRSSIDKPQEIQDAIKETMREFYKAIKANDQYIHFVFLTGVTKFYGLAIFSALNNIEDITLDPKYCDICGYTQDELANHFGELIPELTKKYSYKNNEKTLKRIKYWYNGYSWDGKTAIYNPYSTLNLFTNLEFSNYWLEIGTPGFLASLIKQKKYSELIYRHERAFSQRELLGFNMEKFSVPTLLFQSGYLTIREIEMGKEKKYRLSWPNAEVRKSFFDSLLNLVENANEIEDEIAELSKQIEESIIKLDASLFSSVISKVLTKIPFNLFKDKGAKEAIYHSSLLLALWACGFDAWGEDNTNIGIIDVTWKFDDFLYVVMEVKQTNKVEKLDHVLKLAKKQIEDRKYYEKYLTKKIKVISMPIVFVKAPKKMVVKCGMREIEK